MPVSRVLAQCISCGGGVNATVYTVLSKQKRKR